MAKTEAQKRADANYRARRVHRVPLDMQKRDFEALAAAVRATGAQNVNSFVRSAINEKIDRDGLREIADEAARNFDARQADYISQDVKLVRMPPADDFPMNPPETGDTGNETW